MTDYKEELKKLLEKSKAIIKGINKVLSIN